MASGWNIRNWWKPKTEAATAPAMRKGNCSGLSTPTKHGWLSTTMKTSTTRRWSGRTKSVMLADVCVHSIIRRFGLPTMETYMCFPRVMPRSWMPTYRKPTYRQEWSASKLARLTLTAITVIWKNSRAASHSCAAGTSPETISCCRCTQAKLTHVARELREWLSSRRQEMGIRENCTM